MKRIKLTQGKFAIVDDKDFEYLNQFKWFAQKDGYTWYALRRGKQRKIVRMHRLLTGISKGKSIDHINGNGLDNRRENLRICTQQQNICNSRKRKNTSSKYKGVSWYARGHKWAAYIQTKNKQKHLGYFDKAIEAALAYNTAAKKLHGQFARLNVL